MAKRVQIQSKMEPDSRSAEKVEDDSYESEVSIHLNMDLDLDSDSDNDE